MRDMIRLLGKTGRRRLVQALSLLALNSYVFQFKFICLPILHCHSCPLATFACPIGVMGQYSELYLLPFLVIGFLGVIGVLFGRFFCGWICPFGFLQDMLYKLPTPKFRIPAPLRYVKYGVLVILVLAVPFFLGSEASLYFCRLCPAGTLESAIPRAILSGGFPAFYPAVARIAILIAAVASVIGNERFFCKVLCPQGAIMAVFNRFCALSFTKDSEKCVKCGLCRKVCPMDLDPMSKSEDDSGHNPAECILCLQCSDNCPSKGALKPSFLLRKRRTKPDL